MEWHLQIHYAGGERKVSVAMALGMDCCLAGNQGNQLAEAFANATQATCPAIDAAMCPYYPPAAVSMVLQSLFGIQGC